MAHVKAIFVILCITVGLIAIVELRIVNNRNFYHWRKAVVQEQQLKQSLYQHQIRLESLITSSEIAKQLKQSQ